MIRADEPAVFDLAARECGTAMNAKILEYTHPFRVAEGDEAFAQQGESPGLADHFLICGDWVPIIRQ